MKKLVTGLTALVLSAVAFAENDTTPPATDTSKASQVTPYFVGKTRIFGVDMSLNNAMTLAGNSNNAIEMESGFGGFMGYDMILNNGLGMQLDLEYHSNGVADTLDSDILLVNIRPKYYVFNGLYVSATAGIGLIGLQPAYGLERTETVTQFGGELGYTYKGALSLVAGYRQLTTEVDSTEITITGPYAGLRLKF